MSHIGPVLTCGFSALGHQGHHLGSFQKREERKALSSGGDLRDGQQPVRAALALADVDADLAQ